MLVIVPFDIVHPEILIESSVKPLNFIIHLTASLRLSVRPFRPVVLCNLIITVQNVNTKIYRFACMLEISNKVIISVTHTKSLFLGENPNHRRC